MSLILPSLDQQTRAAREEAGVEFMWHHIDTCLSSYLGDHHNRDGELLLGVYVDGASTVKDVLSDLVSEFRDIAYELGEPRAGYDHDKAREALMRFTDANAGNEDKLFDASLEILDDDEFYDDQCQAWFLLTWEVPQSKT